MEVGAGIRVGLIRKRNCTECFVNMMAVGGAFRVGVINKRKGNDCATHTEERGSTSLRVDVTYLQLTWACVVRMMAGVQSADMLVDVGSYRKEGGCATSMIESVYVFGWVQ